MAEEFKDDQANAEWKAPDVTNSDSNPDLELLATEKTKLAELQNQEDQLKSEIEGKKVEIELKTIELRKKEAEDQHLTGKERFAYIYEGFDFELGRRNVGERKI